jgi:thiosulfate/3-mercaptopyruvate sulfurtransferase
VIEGLLVSTSWLGDHLGEAGLRVFDATVHLDVTPRGLRARSGREDYESGHIPGAGFLDLISDLSDPSSDLDFTRPSPNRLEEVLSRSGVSNGDRVVIYSGSSVMWATRVWWLLRAAGLESVSVLDGGLTKWRAEGRPVSREPCSYPPGVFRATPQEQLWATKDEVLRAIGQHGVCTINALPRSIYIGETGLGYRRPGHIEASLNVPFHTLVDPETGVYRSEAELVRQFESAGALEKDRIITYCGGAIAATLNAFALTLVGHPNVAVYDGSIDEWARDPSLPMTTGDEP